MTLAASAIYYGTAADRHEEWLQGQPVVLGDTRLTSLAFASRFNRDLHHATIKDSSGLARWVTQKQMRIYGIVARISLSPDGRARMLDIALEAQCCTSTVSRTLLKLQAWGLYAVDIRRGRNGGITVRRPFGQWARAYVLAARQKLAELANRARIKLASISQGPKTTVYGSVGLQDNYLVTMDASFTPTFAQRVMYERGLLALEDPEGEAESIPVDRDKLLGMPEASEIEVMRAALDKLMREAAFAGDWALWERLKVERWPNGYGQS